MKLTKYKYNNNKTFKTNKSGFTNKKPNMNYKTTNFPDLFAATRCK